MKFKNLVSVGLGLVLSQQLFAQVEESLVCSGVAKFSKPNNLEGQEVRVSVIVTHGPKEEDRQIIYLGPNVSMSGTFAIYNVSILFPFSYEVVLNSNSKSTISSSFGLNGEAVGQFKIQLTYDKSRNEHTSEYDLLYKDEYYDLAGSVSCLGKIEELSQDLN
jgi:hypothetical protein